MIGVLMVHPKPWDEKISKTGIQTTKDILKP